VKTGLDIVDIVYAKLRDSSLDTEITGAICRKRPINSKLEDVVLNCLPVPNSQYQQTVVNVNIYTPNKTQNFTGGVDNSQPDIVRLKMLTNIAVTILKDNVGADYIFDIQQTVGPIQGDNNDHYMNIRLNFYSENL
jgi:hypothetical protein